LVWGLLLRDLTGLTPCHLGDIVDAYLDVVYQDVVEVDRCGQIGACDHLVVDEELEVMGAGWEIDDGFEVTRGGLTTRLRLAGRTWTKESDDHTSSVVDTSCPKRQKYR